jgi:hypothetical protein
VRYGQPVESRQSSDCIDPPDEIQTLMRQCVGQIAQLAGRPEFVPQFAGRQWKPTPAELAEAMAAGRPRDGQPAN